MRLFKLSRLLIIFFFISNATASKGLQIPIEKLHNYADALYIEGGIIPKQHLTNDAIWVNLAVVLDQPVVTGETLDKITENNKFTLKEASILNYNEKKVNLAYTAIIDYYLNNANKIIKNTTLNKPIKMVWHIHRNSSANNHLKLLLNLLNYYIKSNQLIKLPINKSKRNFLGYYYYTTKNILIEVKSGIKGEDLEQDQDTNIVLSFSMAAGLNTSLPSSSLLIPNKFIPYSVNNNEIILDKEYQVNNHLIYSLLDILKETQKKEHIFITNKQIQSENQQKTFLLEPLKKTDFTIATILQADAMFYPSLRK